MNALTVRKMGGLALPDNNLWEMRFEIHSETSNRIYIIARNKKSKKWGCSCPAYRTRRYCKHLLQGCQLDPSEIHGNALADDRKKHLAIGSK
jgi:hypothetical protein